MKVPLRYQVTEFDCGPISIFNALNYLFEREEIPADLIKSIMQYTLDEYNHHANAGGTSREAMKFLTNWLNAYAISTKLDLVCLRYEGSEININVIREWIAAYGALIVRLIQSNEHYVTLTAMDDDYVYLFDSYYFPLHHYDSDPEVDIITDHPLEYNRRVSINRFLSESNLDFSLGSIKNREIIGMKRKKEETIVQ